MSNHAAPSRRPAWLGRRRSEPEASAQPRPLRPASLPLATTYPSVSPQPSLGALDRQATSAVSPAGSPAGGGDGGPSPAPSGQPAGHEPAAGLGTALGERVQCGWCKVYGPVSDMSDWGARTWRCRRIDECMQQRLQQDGEPQPPEQLVMLSSGTAQQAGEQARAAWVAAPAAEPLKPLPPAPEDTTPGQGSPQDGTKGDQ